VNGITFKGMFENDMFYGPFKIEYDKSGETCYGSYYSSRKNGIFTCKLEGKITKKENYVYG